MQIGMSPIAYGIVSIWALALFLIFLLVMAPGTDTKYPKFYDVCLSSNLRSFATSEVIGLICSFIWFIVESFNILQILFVFLFQTILAIGLSLAGGTFRNRSSVIRNSQKLDTSFEK